MTFMKFSYTVLIMMIGLFCAGPVMRRGEAKKPQLSASEMLCIASGEANSTAKAISEMSRKQDSALSEIQTKVNILKTRITGIKPKPKERIKIMETEKDTCFYAPGYYEQQ